MMLIMNACNKCKIKPICIKKNIVFFTYQKLNSPKSERKLYENQKINVKPFPSQTKVNAALTHELSAHSITHWRVLPGKPGRCHVAVMSRATPPSPRHYEISHIRSASDYCNCDVTFFERLAGRFS